MDDHACPPAELLERFFRNALSPDERKPIAAHVAGCDRCLGQADTVSGASPPGPSGPDAPLARGTLVGRYVVLRLLGGGAMGFVYEAVDPDLERNVALKLVRTEGKTSEARARLLREAQAMARLSHPYVVPIFDVGTTESGEVFLAMERVNGQTLAEWCASERDWRRILRYYLYAGRGLAAAHAAGLVHRDFKPKNVLVGKDGRVRVTDFGLVRLEAAPEPSRAPAPLPVASLGRPITRDGAIVGTPHYMSPEQLSGEKVDARSDQFSFCVALYEALYEERPFAGERLHEVLANQLLDNVRDPPTGARIPQCIRKALLRGLRRDPAERFPSMEALSTALSRDPGRSWRRAGAVAGIAVGIAALAAGIGVARRAAPPCASAGAPLLESWNPAARKRLSAVFAATGKPFAAGAFRAFDAALSTYVAHGARVAERICVAARIQHRTPPEVHGRQVACLDQRRAELGKLLELLSRAAPATLARTSQAVDHLARFEDCTRAQALAIRVSPARALHPDEARDLEAALVEARAQNALGRYREALDRVERALKGAPHLAQTPLAAQVETERAISEQRLEHLPAAEASFGKAALLSERFGDDALAAEVWIGRATVETDLARYPEAARSLALARAKLDRLGTPLADTEVRWRIASAHLAYQQGHYQRTVELVRHLLAGNQGLLEVRRGALHETLGNAEKALGHLEAAAVEYAQAVKLTERALGPNHPALASKLNMLAGVRHRQGNDEAARALYRRALRIDDDALGPDSLSSARMLNNLALLEMDEGHAQKALGLLRRAQAIKERRLGAGHPLMATSLINEANALVALERLPEAEDALTRAAKILITREGADHPNLVAVYSDLGMIRQEQGRLTRAEVSFGKAIALAEKKLGPRHPWLAYSLFGAGLNALSRHRVGLAERELERALSIDRGNGSSEANRAEVEFGLARALWTAGHDRHRARALAEDAAKVARKGPLPDGPPAAEIERWLKSHR